MKKNDPIDVESVILDAELLIKYHLPERGIVALETALDRHPTNTQLREKLLDLYISQKKLDQAASQCIALSGLYVRAGNFEEANRCLMQARSLNPQASVSSKLQELRRMQQEQQRLNTPPVQIVTAAAPAQPAGPPATLAGNLADVSIFDVVQILENNHLTGILGITKEEINGKVYFTEGEIVNATMDKDSGVEAFKQLMQAASGSYFTFNKSPVPFAREINAANNTSLILDLLREYDEEQHADEMAA
jgi:tetratricopeptide (TPR) repeat protein